MDIKEIYTLIENRNLKDDELRKKYINNILNSILESCVNKKSIYIRS